MFKEKELPNFDSKSNGLSQIKSKSSARSMYKPHLFNISQ